MTWQAAATRDGTEIYGADDEPKTVGAGKVADLIVVDRNPLDDISNLQRVQLVFKDGRIVYKRR